MEETVEAKPKFRGAWAPALSSPAKPRNFAVPEKGGGRPLPARLVSCQEEQSGEEPSSDSEMMEIPSPIEPERPLELPIPIDQESASEADLPLDSEPPMDTEPLANASSSAHAGSSSKQEKETEEVSSVQRDSLKQEERVERELPTREKPLLKRRVSFKSSSEAKPTFDAGLALAEDVVEKSEPLLQAEPTMKAETPVKDVPTVDAEPPTQSKRKARRMESPKIEEAVKQEVEALPRVKEEPIREAKREAVLEPAAKESALAGPTASRVPPSHFKSEGRNFRHSMASPSLRSAASGYSATKDPRKPVVIPLPPKKELQDDVIDFLSAERTEIHERELAREMARYRESTNDRVLQRQLDNIQFKISAQINTQMQQEQAEQLRQQQRERRRQMLKRMIGELQSELDEEERSEQLYQQQRKQHREEAIEEFRKWDGEISKVRDRIEKAHDINDQEREKAARVDEAKVGKAQKLYYETLLDKDPNAAMALERAVPAAYKEAAAAPKPQGIYRRGKTTTRHGSEALQRILDRLQGLSDSDEELLSSDED